MDAATFLLLHGGASGGGHVDPSQIPLETLARIRGSMWTARLNLPYGPRPGKDSNILPMDFYELYSVEDRARMLAAYKQRGYTHAVTGPLTGGDGYHGQFPDPFISRLPTMAEFDGYLDRMQEWWDAGIAPVHFMKPDNWTLEQVAALEPFYLQPRAQRLLRIVVPPGWEPTRYGWSAATWAEFLKWGRRIFPNALILAHSVTDVDALTGDDERHHDTGMGNDKAWHITAPHMHGWLVQLGGYVEMKDSAGHDMDRNSSEFPAGLATFRANMAEYFGGRTGLGARFRQGYAGWPTGSLWGPSTPLKIYAAEYAAYIDYWQDWPEDEARDLGDLAIASTVDGYLDGGRLDVP